MKFLPTSDNAYVEFSLDNILLTCWSLESCNFTIYLSASVQYINYRAGYYLVCKYETCNLEIVKPLL